MGQEHGALGVDLPTGEGDPEVREQVERASIPVRVPIL
jgi:hypothetical protein